MKKSSYCPDCVHFRHAPGWWWCEIKNSYNAVIIPPCEGFKERNRTQEILDEYLIS